MIPLLAMSNMNFAPILGIFAAMAFLGVILGIAMYVYMALVWQTIAKKLKYNKPWLAWIPIANFFLLPILAKKEWGYGFLFFIPIVNIVFFIIWTWKIYERRNFPGWLSLIPLLSIIPLINFLVMPAELVVLGIVAWSKKK
ncbi:MAG: hypothetical protein PHR26_02840 [Candidatus ainarchaeum sp.]|nr:hypothetical protein [Candidatus ainarchaeum sp.]MDD3975935.1 hypothetical protein [Candidatus ainarchaeum sp.]